MTGETYVGVFRGRKTIQRSATIGGARSVFVKLQDNGNDFKYPTFGGYIKNPFKGTAKAFAGDLFEFRTDENGVNPELYLLKTYLVESVSGNVVNIVKDDYKHKPFVGDILGKAPDEISGETTASIITAVTTSKVGKQEVWACSFAGNIFVEKGDILVECNEVAAGTRMLVQKINAVAPTDLDMFDAPATGDEDFDGARYSYTPALGGLMYESKMSPLPACVKKLNISNVTGWFQVRGVY